MHVLCTNTNTHINAHNDLIHTVLMTRKHFTSINIAWHGSSQSKIEFQWHIDKYSIVLPNKTATQQMCVCQYPTLLNIRHFNLALMFPVLLYFYLHLCMHTADTVQFFITLYGDKVKLLLFKIKQNIYKRVSNCEFVDSEILPLVDNFWSQRYLFQFKC